MCQTAAIILYLGFESYDSSALKFAPGASWVNELSHAGELAKGQKPGAYCNAGFFIDKASN
jgi:hypothetical protein